MASAAFREFADKLASAGSRRAEAPGPQHPRRIAEWRRGAGVSAVVAADIPAVVPARRARPPIQRRSSRRSRRRAGNQTSADQGRRSPLVSPGATNTSSAREPADAASLGDGVALVRRVLAEATTPPRWPMYPRQFKQFLRTAQPDFDERRYGSIADLMRACQKDGLLQPRARSPGRAARVRRFRASTRGRCRTAGRCSTADRPCRGWLTRPARARRCTTRSRPR